jgi:hypothetical protein
VMLLVLLTWAIAEFFGHVKPAAKRAESAPPSEH